MVRREWGATTNALTMAMAEAASAVADGGVLRTELAMVEEQLVQARLLMAQVQKDVDDQVVRVVGVVGVVGVVSAVRV